MHKNSQSIFQIPEFPLSFPELTQFPRDFQFFRSCEHPVSLSLITTQSHT